MNAHETTIKVWDRTREDFGLERRMISIPFTFDLDKVFACRPELSEKDPYGEGRSYDGTIIYMETGESFWINEDYVDIKQMID